MQNIYSFQKLWLPKFWCCIFAGQNAIIRVRNMLMRRSNCSAPIPPGSPGVRENIRVIKKGGGLEKRVILVII